MPLNEFMSKYLTDVPNVVGVFFCYTSICICTLCTDAFMLCHMLQLFLLLQGLGERSDRGTRPITDAFSKTASAVKSSVIFV